MADVQSSNIGAGTTVWQFVGILPGAKIGRDCNICSHCLIDAAGLETLETWLDRALDAPTIEAVFAGHER